MWMVNNALYSLRPYMNRRSSWCKLRALDFNRRYIVLWHDELYGMIFMCLRDSYIHNLLLHRPSVNQPFKRDFNALCVQYIVTSCHTWWTNYCWIRCGVWGFYIYGEGCFIQSLQSIFLIRRYYALFEFKYIWNYVYTSYFET